MNISGNISLRVYDAWYEVRVALHKFEWSEGVNIRCSCNIYYIDYKQ